MRSTAIASSESSRVLIRYGAPHRAATGSAKEARRKGSCVQTGTKAPGARSSTSERKPSLQRSSSSTSHSNSASRWLSTEGRQAS